MYHVLSGNGREAELMQAVQLLVDKLNHGQLPLSAEAWESMKAGNVASTTTNTINPGSIQVHGQSDLLRRENAERLQLERDLSTEERKALEAAMVDDDKKRQALLKEKAEELASKLQGKWPLNTLRPRQYVRLIQTIFSNALSWKNFSEFLINFDWSLFLRAQSTITQHRFR